MYVLGLNIGHNATACLIKDGKIISCVSEERFTRIKNYCGVPKNSIKYVLDSGGITIENVELVVTDDYYPIYEDPYYGERYLHAYVNISLKKKLFSWWGYKFPRAFNMYYGIKSIYNNINKPSQNKLFKTQLANQIKIDPSKILLVNHHLAHALSSCSNLSKNKKTLIFTSDGEGSGLSATVNVFDGNKIRVISKTSKFDSIGCLYAIATIYLGMKPLEHEFKVMGLAPYAKEHHVNKVYKKLKSLFRISEDLVIHSKFNIPFVNHFFEKEMRFVRFDTFAGAVQRLTEELVTEWIAKSIKKTGINDVALSGGVFMNVKANQKIAELPEVRSLFVMPSCGDESNAIGCAIFGYKTLCEKKSMPFKLESFTHLYFGPEYDELYVRELIKKQSLHKKYNIMELKEINKEIAKLLAKGEIVARCSGKSEWGARALGNRSILANPSNPDSIRVLNETIKDRDFWMPFTPSILADDANRYILNPKKIDAPYMVLTFNSTKLAKKHLPAAMHPYDSTLRPQIVYKNWNPDYYDIIAKFKKLTGIGGILNTSFNLHGEPNVLTPEDALHTVENSSLKYLAIGNFLFEKKA